MWWRRRHRGLAAELDAAPQAELDAATELDAALQAELDTATDLDVAP